MIFVTVGTHEQQFNRLVEYMDTWAGDHKEEVVIQTGFSTYKPKKTDWIELLPYNRMIDYINMARIVITHGGPSSFLLPLQFGKIPIVVPRNSEFHEHINNHQIEFCRKVSKCYKNIIVVEDVNDLGEVLVDYEEIIKGFNNILNSNNERFCTEFEKIVTDLVHM